MADYIVKDTELTSVANAIRTAGGTNSLLSFPNGFVNAVNNISGGGSSDFSTATLTVVNNASGDITGQFSAFPIVADGLTASGRMYVVGNSTETYTVIIGENGCQMLADGQLVDSEHTLSGDITFVQEELWSYFIITGDCTITVNALE